jgi:DNA-binding NtrC family response regulator
LRERVEDVAPLAWHILEQHDPEVSFTSRALRLLESYAWPGNVRELRNVVMKAAVMNADMEIDAEHLPVGFAARPSPLGGGAPSDAVSNHASANGANGASLDHMERRMIFDALAAAGGHQQQAAARLGISRRTLSRKLKIYEAERGRATA